MKNKYRHIDEKGSELMDSIPPGSLLRVKWIENPNVDAEWGQHILWFDDTDYPELDSIDSDQNVVMLLEWMPEIYNSQNVITFKCLWENNIYYSSTAAINSIIEHDNEI